MADKNHTVCKAPWAKDSKGKVYQKGQKIPKGAKIVDCAPGFENAMGIEPKAAVPKVSK